MTWGWIKKEEITCFLTFLSTSLHAAWISYLSYVWAGILRQLYILCSWHQTCAVVKTLWHSDKHSDIPRDKRMKPRRLPCLVPSIAIGPQKAYQPPHWCPSLDLTGVFDRSAVLLAALLHCPCGQSAPQLALLLWMMPSLLLHVKKRARSHRGSANIL